MSGAALLTVIGSLGVPTIVASVIAFVGSRASLRANQPKTEAEADQVAATTTVQNLTAQSSVIATLVTENTRLSNKVGSLEQRVGELENLRNDLRTQHEKTGRELDRAMRQGGRMKAHIDKCDRWIAHVWAEGVSLDEPPPAEFNAAA